MTTEMAMITFGIVFITGFFLGDRVGEVMTRGGFKYFLNKGLRPRVDALGNLTWDKPEEKKPR